MKMKMSQAVRIAEVGELTSLILSKGMQEVSTNLKSEVKESIRNISSILRSLSLTTICC